MFTLAAAIGARSASELAPASAVFNVAGEREHLWSLRPGKWLLISSVVDLGLISTLAANGILMHALPLAMIGALLLAAAFPFVLDTVKLLAFRRFAVA